MNSKILILVTLVTLFPTFGFTQTDSANTSFSTNYSVELASRRIWRGSKANNSPEVQTTLDLAYKNLYVGIWGAYTLNEAPMQEIDLWLGYTYKQFSLTIYDYWNPSDTLGWRSDLFVFDKHKTTHLTDLVVEYNGTRVPINILASVFVYGSDRNNNGNNRYSTYFELGYTHKFNDFDFIPFAGFSPTKNGYYCESINFVNVGFSIKKTFKISENYSIPTNCSLIINPYKETMNLTLKLAIL